MSDELVQYAIAGETDRVLELLQRGAELSPVLLHKTIFAGWAQREDVRVLEVLLDHGADPNSPEEGGATPLHAAAQVGAFPSRSLAVTELLIARGADVNARDDLGRTPLHIAVTTNAVDTVKRLLEAGADGDAADAEGDTPLHACMASYCERVEDLEDVEEAEMAQDTVVMVLEHLLAHGVDLDRTNAADETALAAVLRRPGYPEALVEVLAEAGASLTVPVFATETHVIDPLAAALVQRYSPAFAARLVAAGNDPTRVHDFLGGAVITVATATQPAFARALLDADPELLHWRTALTSSSLLHCAILGDDPEWIRELVERGVDVTAKNKDGLTPREVAQAKGLAVALEALG